MVWCVCVCVCVCGTACEPAPCYHYYRLYSSRFCADICVVVRTQRWWATGTNCARSIVHCNASSQGQPPRKPRRRLGRLEAAAATMPPPRKEGERARKGKSKVRVQTAGRIAIPNHLPLPTTSTLHPPRTTLAHHSTFAPALRPVNADVRAQYG